MNNRFKKLNRKARRAFASLLSIAVICTTTGIGTIFAEAYETIEDTSAATDASSDSDSTGALDETASNSASAISSEDTLYETGETDTLEETDISEDAYNDSLDYVSKVQNDEEESDDYNSVSGNDIDSILDDEISDDSDTTSENDENDDSISEDEAINQLKDMSGDELDDLMGDISDEQKEALYDYIGIENLYDSDEIEETDLAESEEIELEGYVLNSSTTLLDEVSVDAVNVTYDGSSHELVQMNNLDTSLYNVIYTLNGSTSTSIPQKTNAGTYSVDVKVYSIADNTRTAETTVTSTISGKTITSDMITLSTSDGSDYEFLWTGSAVEPVVTVTDTVNGESVTLSQGSDYTVAYSNNVDKATTTSGTPPTVTVTGTGNYSGTATKLFNIGSQITLSSISATFYSGIYDHNTHPVCSDVTYDSSEVDQVTYVLDDGAETTVVPTVTDAGTYKVTVKYYGIGSGSTVYCDTSKTDYCIISSKGLDNDDITVSMESSYAYTGTDVTPVVTVTDGSYTLTSGVDYTVTYSNNIKAAQASDTNAPTITITGMGNYKNEITRNFSIVDYSEEIEIWYNNKSTKQDWYTKDVTIMAPGYTMSTSTDGEFVDSYTITGEGIGVGANLYFKNDSTSTVSPAIAVSVNIDSTAPTGSIKAGDYMSEELNESYDLAYYTKDKDTIKISSSDNLSGIDTVEYYIGKKLYASGSAIEKAVGDSWTTYDKDNKPKINVDSSSFIYAKIVDVAGNKTYISSQGILNDTQAPTVSSVTETLHGENMLVAVAASDDLTGVEKYYLSYFKSSDDPGQMSSSEVVAGENSAIEGLFSIPALTDTTYVYYAVAVDGVGNVSDVYKKEGSKKGTGSSDSSSESSSGSSSKSSSSSSGSQGLTPVPNGIAGGSSGSTSGKNTNTGSKTENIGITESGKNASTTSGGTASGSKGDAIKITDSDSNTTTTSNISDRVITRDPYITDATGEVHIGKALTSGWDSITSEIVGAKDGTSIDVDMSGTSIVPVRTLQALKAKDVQITLDMPDDYKWTINGKTIDTLPAEDIDLSIVSGSKNIPSTLLNELADVYPHYDFEIKHDGEFGFTATLTVNVDSSNAGMYGNLFYYNVDKGQLELVDSTKVNEDGIVSYEMTHASDYTVIIKPVSMEELASAENTEYTTTGTITEYTADTITSTGVITGQGKFTGLRNWLFMIALISVVLGIIILFIPSLQNETDEFFDKM